MAEYVGVSGVVHKVKEKYCGVGGAVHKIKETYSSNAGVVKKTFSSGLTIDTSNIIIGTHYGYENHDVAQDYWSYYPFIEIMSGIASYTIEGNTIHCTLDRIWTDDDEYNYYSCGIISIPIPKGTKTITWTPRQIPFSHIYTTVDVLAWIGHKRSDSTNNGYGTWEHGFYGGSTSEYCTNQRSTLSVNSSKSYTLTSGSTYDYISIIHTAGNTFGDPVLKIDITFE